MANENQLRAEQLKEELARKYRQPKGVEQFGIEAVPPELKTAHWWDLFNIIINFLIQPGMMVIAGLAIASGLPFWGAVVTSVSGVFIAYVAYVVMATVGVDYGIPGQVATRMAFGIQGSKWLPSLVRVLASIYWFAFQTLAGAAGITAILNAMFGLNVSLILVSVIFAIFQALIAILGYDSLKVLSKIAFPAKIVLIAMILYLLINYPEPNFNWNNVLSYPGTIGWHWPTLALWINSVIAAWICMITDAADFCRYSASRLDMWIATVAAACVGTFISAFVGAYAAAATLGEYTNVFELMPVITQNGVILFFVLIVIVLENWCINVMNVYTGGLSFSNIFTKIGRFWSTILIAAGGVMLSAVPSVVYGFTDYMDVLGFLFAPIAGILLVDYLFIKKTYIDIVALFKPDGAYRYTNGFNLVAVALTALGFVFYLIVPEVLIKNLATLVVVGIAYYFAMKAVASTNETYAEAARPGKQYDEIPTEAVNPTV
ncbi:MAG: cytosine permease [Thermacetogeniaceae bacterium]|jgi:NCS1 nucleoside transporter family